MLNMNSLPNGLVALLGDITDADNCEGASPPRLCSRLSRKLDTFSEDVRAGVLIWGIT
jgi:hypothetical protein